MRRFVICSLKHALRVFLILAIIGSVAQAQKIKVEYDKSIDFSKFKTFAIDPVDNGERPMLRLAIMGAVEHDLNRLGLTKVASNPDLYVQMYGAVDTDLTAHYHDPVYGGYIPNYNSRVTLWHNIPGTTTTVVIPKGTLVVDLIDANQKQLVWRGVAKQTLSDSKEKVIDQVNTSVEKMFLKYPVGNK
ncbi:MAG TPA: DUF4136 domain-containing protein [Candidatus Angelobacter sp.]|nr:DUF4136 domain-containing protein [Candidatus Angelobacter sp.]